MSSHTYVYVATSCEGAADHCAALGVDGVGGRRHDGVDFFLLQPVFSGRRFIWVVEEEV